MQKHTVAPASQRAASSHEWHSPRNRYRTTKQTGAQKHTVAPVPAGCKQSHAARLAQHRGLAARGHLGSARTGAPSHDPPPRFVDFWDFFQTRQAAPALRFFRALSHPDPLVFRCFVGTIAHRAAHAVEATFRRRVVSVGILQCPWVRVLSGCVGCKKTRPTTTCPSSSSEAQVVLLWANNFLGVALNLL